MGIKTKAKWKMGESEQRKWECVTNIVVRFNGNYWIRKDIVSREVNQIKEMLWVRSGLKGWVKQIGWNGVTWRGEEVT